MATARNQDATEDAALVAADSDVPAQPPTPEVQAERLEAATATRPKQEEGESTEDYVRRLRELQVEATRTNH